MENKKVFTEEEMKRLKKVFTEEEMKRLKNVFTEEEMKRLKNVFTEEEIKQILDELTDREIRSIIDGFIRVSSKSWWVSLEEDIANAEVEYYNQTELDEDTWNFIINE